MSIRSYEESTRTRQHVEGAEDGPEGQAFARNLSGTERLVTTAAGLGLGLWGLRRSGLAGAGGAVAGALLMLRGASGHCPLYARFGGGPFERNVAHEHGWRTAVCVRESIHIDCDRMDVYLQWRDLRGLGRRLDHVLRVDPLDAIRSHWQVKTPLGQTVEWDAAITEDVEGERIGWVSSRGAQVRNCGWIEFHDSADGSGTDVHLLLAYEPPGAEFGRVVARLFGDIPARLVRSDLHCFKEWLEMGPVPKADREQSEPARQTRAGNEDDPIEEQQGRKVA